MLNIAKDRMIVLLEDRLANTTNTEKVTMPQLPEFMNRVSQHVRA